MAAKYTIAEAEEIVEVGELDPNHIHTPAAYVQALVKGERYDKPVERLTLNTGTQIQVQGMGDSSGMGNLQCFLRCH